jgi:hypothetical protein
VRREVDDGMRRIGDFLRRSGQRIGEGGEPLLALSFALGHRTKRLTARPPVAHEAGVHLTEEELIVVGERAAIGGHRASVGREVFDQEASELAIATGLPEGHGQLVELLRVRTRGHYVGGSVLEIEARHHLPACS